MSTTRADPADGWKANTARVCLRLSAIGVMPLLAVGCAEMHWQKTGADAATIEEDLQICARIARFEAKQGELPRLDSPLTIRADPLGRPVVAPNTTRDSDRFLLEQDLTAACMRSKGYVRVRDKR